MVKPTEGAVVTQQEPLKKLAEVRDLNFYYGHNHALKNINMPIYEKKVTALIGPSGCGKTTLLRCFNRMHDLYPGNRYEGQILLGADQPRNLLEMDPIEVRMQIGMVFQKPNPFPKSIYENIVYGLRVRGIKDKAILDEVMERSLRNAALWDEVKDRLKEPGTSLSGGQQQRLCIARALATDPKIILFDEPTSALDPIATVNIENLIVELKDQVTILIVTHNMQQAIRVSQFTAFMYLGELVEFNDTMSIFTKPVEQKTADYVSGRFG
ncbi:MAG: phosphate ABC transporter ATP-binding protein PstB [Thermosynechococcus sp. Uc]|uniref:phosphate ABC transporter ATP-binding protein PstB n=1 Tax=Thermosynechococcus sp. Uc TaxID=3034853 RepID=UPI0019EB16CB|nr:phosphate ABC transporter ATP-binding protein PstB [Thermosynechococcus sp. Uc]MDM7325644.1 phosphate ABC transporter ATP-binding protein PstB [Thermosynechococcus sp. Uc]HIK26405.1 phosphate ABC transporter ATP-binding protein [Thermosynechococcus sp. M46_R2017_013]